MRPPIFQCFAFSADDQETSCPTACWDGRLGAVLGCWKRIALSRFRSSTGGSPALQLCNLGGWGAHYSVAIIIKLHAPLGFRTRVCGIGQYFKGVLPAIPQTENRRFAIKSPTENTHFGGYFNQNNAYRGIDTVCWLFLNRKSTTLRQTANQQ